MTDGVARLREALSDRYAVERELGQGGMATVYLAHDQKLGRPVALKVLKPELAAALGPERFLREIEIAAKLNHPNILALHDCGTTTVTEPTANGQRLTATVLYYTMPFVEGESLRGRLEREKQLPLDDALQIAKEVADALGYAHALGLVHRDVKPENILFQAGHALVADFGIARAVTAAGGTKLTETGLAIGTPAYMSPEQAAGNSDLDARSDLYSLGCVLYEMLTGETPYTGPSAQAILAKKLSEPVGRVSVMRDTVPAGVEAALHKALARTPADRFVTAADFAGALAKPETLAPVVAATARPWWARRSVQALAMLAVLVLLAAAATVGLLRRGAHRPPVGVAILPFENLSAPGPDTLLAGAIHSELVTQLGRVAALSVRSRTAVEPYAHTTKSLPVIGKELGVARVVEGSVQVAGNRLRVNVQLIDAATQAPLWGNTYDRTLDDVFAVQSEIAQRIAEMVGGALTRAEAAALGTPPTQNSEAYRLYLEGEEQRIRTCCDPTVFQSAQHLLEHAIELDPDFALAHASLSRVHGWVQVNGWDTDPERVNRQRAEAETALRLAPRSPQAHLAMGWVFWLAPTALRSDMRQALQEFTIAAEEAPSSAEAWDNVSLAYAALREWDRYDAARDRAAALEPRNAARSLNAAVTFWERHRYAEAEREFNVWLSLVAPEDVPGHNGDRTLFYVVWQGTLDSLRALVNRQGCNAGWIANRLCVQLAFLEREPNAVLSSLSELPSTIYEGFEVYEPTPLWAAWAHQLRGDSASARRAFGAALSQLDSASRTLPDDPRLHASRGLALAGLGRHAEAKAEADWLLAPVDSLETDYSQYYRTSAALILAQGGYTDEALVQIERLLSGPSKWVSVPLLRIDPRWDPIRDDPGFRALLAKYARPHVVG
jgi:TolB-like protein/tetratricopeptide (TPR) repeat protein